MVRIAVVLGTRPEIIKMTPIVRACEARGVDFFILHTGQHYSYEMDQVFFEQLALPKAKHNLDVGSGPHGAQTGKMLAGIERILTQERPTVVLVQGDTNTVLAGALAASKLNIQVGHVEAGLRSHDRTMPEETNRIVADHVADHNFAPTEACAATLRREGIPESRIAVTGNTIVDAVLQNRELAAKRSDAMERLGLAPRGYALMTAHRQENVDDAARFQGMIEGAGRVAKELGIQVVYPIHPRARKQLEAFKLELHGVRLVEPLDFLSFLHLEANARLLLTDSGGVQEEACILGVPCVTLRDNTERPETIDAGLNMLAGTQPERIVAAARRMVNARASSDNPFGRGDAAVWILKHLGV